MTPSLIISDHTRRPRRPDIIRAATVGMSPMPSCSVVPSAAKRPRARRSPLAASSEPCRGGRGQRFVDLEDTVDRLERDLAGAERVGHVGVHLRQDQAAAGPGLLDGGREHVDLNPE